MASKVKAMSQEWEGCAKSLTAVSITARCRRNSVAGVIREAGNYGVKVPRTDENGRQLKALLDYLLDGDVDAKAIFTALGVSSST